VADDTDLSALFFDALKTEGSKGSSPLQSATDAASKAAGQAPTSGAAADRAADLPAQAPQGADQAGSAAKQAFSSAKQAAGNAAQSASPSPPPAAQDAAGSAAQSLKQQAASSLQQGGASAPLQAASSLSDKASSASDALQQGAPSITGSAPQAGPDAPSQLTDGVQSTVATAQDAVAGFVDSVKGAASGLLDSGKSGGSELSSGLGDAKSGLLQSTGSLREAADSGLAAAQSTASGLLGGVNGATGGVQGQAAQLLSSVQAATADLQASASSAAANAVDALPAPAQEAVAQVKAVAGQVASQVAHLVASNPDAAKAAAVPLLGVPLLLTVAGRFGAYKGPLPPSEAYSILQREDALLVDVRTNAERSAQGLPDLQRGALSKGAAVPLDFINTVPASKLRKAKQLSQDVVALAISQLRAVRGGTKVILLDRGDGRAVPIAQRLNKYGVRQAFVVQGGFRQWQRDGLAVRGDRSDYSVSQLQLLGTRTSIAAEETAAVLRNPVSITLGGVAVALAIGVLVDWRRTLQYIGTGGLLLSALARTTSYSKPQDLLDDVSSVGNTLGAPLAAIGGTTKVLASKVQGATSGDSGPAEVLSQPVQPTRPVSEVAAGRAREEPVQVPDAGSGGGGGGDAEGRRREPQAAQLPQSEGADT
jgi:rhodanese-related sulfurtransferase